MMTTYIQSNELKRMESVIDIFLNELFQEVRRKYPDTFYLHEFDRFYQEKWYKPKMVETLYSLYINLGGGEFQCFNFPSIKKGRSSINTASNREMVMMFFYGLLSGKLHDVLHEQNH